MRNWKPNRWFIAVIIAVTVMVAGAASFYVLNPPPVFARSLVDAYPAVLLVPGKGAGEVVPQTPSYDDKLKQITYTVQYVGASIVVSEQPTPEAFVDVPAVYDKMVETMKTYASFDTDIGKVYLTKPDNLGGHQAAVINTKGTLLLAKTDRDLSDAQWRSLFARYIVQH